jgi:rSAM/selenodomain-associated transferase 2
MLSIIIPTLNSEKNLIQLLGQISDQVDDIVVSDGGSRDKSLSTALEHGARLALGCQGRGWQLARGAKWAQGEWMFFVHADTRLPKGFHQVLASHIRTHPNKAGYFKFALNAEGVRPRILEGLANFRTWLFALPYGDQGLLISRALYEEIGGFPDWPLFEDVAIVRKIGRSRLRKLPGKLMTSADKFEHRGYFISWLRNVSLISRYFLGADPAVLVQVYKK